MLAWPESAVTKIVATTVADLNSWAHFTPRHMHVSASLSKRQYDSIDTGWKEYPVDDLACLGDGSEAKHVRREQDCRLTR